MGQKSAHFSWKSVKDNQNFRGIYLKASKLMSTKIVRNEMKFHDLVFDLPEMFYSNFSNSLIIHKEKTKEITTVTVVWIPDLN